MPRLDPKLFQIATDFSQLVFQAAFAAQRPAGDICGRFVDPTGEPLGAPTAQHYGDPVAEQRALAAGRALVDLSDRGVVTLTLSNCTEETRDLLFDRLTRYAMKGLVGPLSLAFGKQRPLAAPPLADSAQLYLPTEGSLM